MLIKGGYVVDSQQIRCADIYLSDGKIREVKTNIEHQRDDTVYVNKKIIIPGFVNAHTHIGMTFLRNVGEGMKLHDWLKYIIEPKEKYAEEKLPKIFEYSSIIGALESIKSGIVIINDMYFNEHIIYNGLSKTPIKAILGNALGCYGVDMKERIRRVEYIKNKKNPKIKPAVCFHALYSGPEENLLKTKEYARKHGYLLHMHVSETREEVMEILKTKHMRVIEYLEKLNILDKNTILAHASWVTKREINIVAKHKSTVVHNPTSNLKLATGTIMPVEEFIQANVNVALGTDGVASNNSLDMFETMKLTGLLQKHKYWNPTSGNPKQIFKMATHQEIFGFKSGLIKPNYDADLVILNPSINMIPLHDIYTSIVYAAKPYNVETVLINGDIVYHKNEFLTIDIEKIINEFNLLMEEIE